MKDGLGNPVYRLFTTELLIFPFVQSAICWIYLWHGMQLLKRSSWNGRKAAQKCIKVVAKTSDLASKVTDKDSLRVKDSSGKEFVYNDGISYRMASGVWSANIDSSYKAKIGGTYSKLSLMYI